MIRAFTLGAILGALAAVAVIAAITSYELTRDKSLPNVEWEGW